MLRSMQTTDTLQAWAQVHRHFVAHVRSERLPGEFVHEKLAIYCRGATTVRDTIKWAINCGLFVANFEDIPTSYSLTERGRNWSSNI
jgi:hypothetical protein